MDTIESIGLVALNEATLCLGLPSNARRQREQVWYCTALWDTRKAPPHIWTAHHAQRHADKSLHLSMMRRAILKGKVLYEDDC